MNVGQPIVASLEPIGMPQVIEAEQVQHRRIQVVNVNRIGNGIEAELIGLAVDVARLDASPCQPDAEAPVVVVATVISPLHHRCPAELPTPDDERLLEQPALFQIADERRARLVCVERILFDPGGQVSMLVPGLMKQLHETNAPFN